MSETELTKEKEVKEEEIELTNMNWCEVNRIPKYPVEHNDIDIISTTWDITYDLVIRNPQQVENSVFFVPYWLIKDPYYKNLYTKQNKIKHFAELLSMLRNFVQPRFMMVYREFPWVRYRDYDIIIKPRIWIDLERDLSHIFVIYKLDKERDNWCTIGYLLYDYDIFSYTKLYYHDLENLIK